MSLFGHETDLTKLVRKCCRQDNEAWGQLVDRFSGLVYSIARRYRLNEDDAADVFQQTFQALYHALDRFEQPDTLPKWISVTSARMSMRLIRAKRQTVSMETEEGTLEDVLASEDESAELEAVRACDAHNLRKAVSGMKDRCGPLLTMLYLEEETSYKLVSERLGIPVGAIGPTRARCLEKLRKALENEGFFE